MIGIRILIILVVCLTVMRPGQTWAGGANPSWSVYFSPHGGCTEAIVAEIDRARNNINVHAYSFTSTPIANALLNAHKRGVKVRVILDKSRRTEKYSSADFLIHAGIETLIDAQHAIAYSKVMSIDGATIITGSFNFTKAAENSNDENLPVIQDRNLAGQYLRDWEQHAGHSEVYEGK